MRRQLRMEREKRKRKIRNKKLVTYLAIFTFVFNILSIFIPGSVYADNLAASLKIEKSVDKSTVYTGDEFTYTIKYSNPNITTDAENVTITDALPAGTVYVSNTTSVDIASVDTPSVGSNGTVIFNFKNTLKAGVSGFVKITVKFPGGTTQADVAAVNSATIKATNDATGGVGIKSNDVTVTSKLNVPNWNITKTKLIPSGIPAVGEPVTYEVKISSNTGNGQLNLHDVRIVDTIPVGSQFVSATNEGALSGDGKLVNWTIGDLNVGASATRYVTVKYPVETFNIGSSVTNLADAFVKLLGSDTEVTKSASITHGFTTATYGIGDFSKSGRQSDDRYSVGQTAKFNLSNIENTGNVSLENIVIEDDIPVEIKLISITTGKYNNAIKLDVYYKTNTNNTWTLWTGGSFISPSNSTLNVSSLNLPIGDYVTNVKWEITNGLLGIPAGFNETNTIGINGIVSMPAGGTTITNNAKLTANEGTASPIVKNASKVIRVIDPMPWLVPTKTMKNGQTTYNMNSDVEYKLVIKNNDFATGDYHNPIAADIVPNELENVIFTGWDKGNSGISNDPVTDDIRTVDGKKLLTWTFVGDLKPGQYVEVYYKAHIKDKTLAGKVINDFYISSNTDSVYENPADDQLADTYDLDNDLSFTDKFVKSTNNIFVKFQGSTDAQKWVKGELDAIWHYYGINHGYGETLPGGIADYELTIKNTGANGPISNIVLIDILPNVGDKGVIDTTARESLWRPYLVNKITGEGGAALDARIKVYYSTNANPSKEELNDPIKNHGQASDLWSLTPPADITTVRALKFDFTTITLATEEQIILEWPMRAPVGAPEGKVAWNSFAYVATYPDVNGQEAFLPSEPKKVGFMVKPQPDSTYNLGNYVWDDLDKNGIQDDGDTGIDGVLVKLCDSSGNYLGKYTRTGQDQQGKHGYYVFPNLSNGHYKVEFVYPKDYKVSPVNAGGDNTKDSDITGSITLTTDNGIDCNSIKTGDVVINGADNLTVDAGLYKAASLGDYVWNDEDKDGIQDLGEKGIKGVTVKLLDVFGVQAKYGDGSDVPDQVTDKDGKYSFNGLEPGKYKIQFVNTNGYFKFSDSLKGSNRATDGLTATTAEIVIKSGENNLSIDQGMYLAELGDYVWHDLNANGTQDAGESGIDGGTVTLTDTLGNSVKNAFEEDVAAVTTISGGKYLFKDLKPGTYKIKFNMPVGYVKPSPQDIGITLPNDNETKDSDGDVTTGVTGDITIAAGDRNLNVDTGFYKLASVGNFVWEDTNGNGVQDALELGIAGVTVNLIGKDGITIVKTTVTGVGGIYSFTGLEPGSYTIEFINPDSKYAFSKTDGTGILSKNSDANVITGKTIPFTLTSGQVNNDIDAGLHKAILGDKVWEDKNGNGLQDSGEPGIQGVKVTLYKDAVQVGTTTTDTSGNYYFYNLEAGSYSVEFSNIPATAKFTQKNNGSDDIDSDVDLVTGKTEAVTLNGGEINTTLDAGIYYPASLGDFVWLDKDGDGMQDANSKGIEGITVKLFDKDGVSLINTTTTGSDGKYIFTNLVPGEYILQFDSDKTYYTRTVQNIGSDNVDSDADVNTGKTEKITIRSGENIIIWDAGFKVKATIGLEKKVYSGHDGGKSTGTELVTDVKGAPVTYTFKVTNKGETYLKDIEINDLTLVPHVDKSNLTYIGGVEPSVPLAPGESRDYYYETTINGDFLNNAAATATPSDENGNVIANIDKPKSEDTASVDEVHTGLNIQKTVYLGKYNPLKIGEELASGKIGEDVTYIFTVLNKGETYIKSLDIKDITLEPSIDKSKLTYIGGIEPTAPLAPGESRDYYYETKINGDLLNKATVEGIQTDINGTPITNLPKLSDENTAQVKALGSIGDYLWFDNNGNGIQDDGILNGIAGVTLVLKDSLGNEIATTTTDNDGKYLFDSLPSGSYSVQVLMGNSLVGYKNSFDKDKNFDSSFDGTLAPGEVIEYVDFGYYKMGKIGDYVWEDTNGNGTQDISEAPIKDVTVNLIDNAGKTVKTTTTDDNGLYKFEDILLGEYYVQFIKPAGYEITKENTGADNAEDSNADVSGKTSKITITAGTDDMTWDAGLYKPASIGDYLWYDSNKNGIQDPLEQPLPNVTLNLLDKDGKIVATTTTGSNGKYIFEKLLPGDYLVEVNLTTLPYNVVQIYELDGKLDGKVSVSLLPGQIVDNIDFGYYKQSSGGVGNPLGSIGDYLWYDNNQNKIQDSGEEPMPNITVSLLDENGKVIASAVTDSKGKYIFDKLLAGNYSVVVTATTLPYNVTKTYELDGILDGRVNVDLDQGQNILNVDFGYYKETSIENGKLASIGDYVWCDKDMDGIQDSNEKGIKGITVKLYDESGNIVKTTTTDANGKYLFTNIIPGKYKVQFVTEKGCQITLKNSGTDMGMDSNVYTSTGITDLFTVDAGDNNLTIDAGIYKHSTVIGIVEDGNSGKPVPGATITVKDEDGNIIGRATTGEDGKYIIKDVINCGLVTIIIQKTGYKDEVIETEIPEDEVPLGSAIFNKDEVQNNGELKNTLPKTGTPYFNLLLLGGLMLGVSGALLFTQKRKKHIK